MVGLLLAGCTSLTDVDVEAGALPLEMETATNREVEFLTADESRQLLDTYRDKLHAVDRIDLRLDEMEPSALLQVGSAVLTHLGQREPLGKIYQKRVLAAVKAGQAVMLPVVTDRAVRSMVQTILVVQALEAL